MVRTPIWMLRGRALFRFSQRNFNSYASNLVGNSNHFRTDNSWPFPTIWLCMIMGSFRFKKSTMSAYIMPREGNSLLKSLKQTCVKSIHQDSSRFEHLWMWS